MSDKFRLVEFEQFEREHILITRLEQQAELRHGQQVTELRLAAQASIHSQETRSRALEQELVRLQGELIHSSQCKAPVNGGGGSSSAVDDAKAHGTIAALLQEVGAARDRERRWAGHEQDLYAENKQLIDRLDHLAAKAHQDQEDVQCEHRAALAMMSHNVDVMMNEVQERTEHIMADLSAQLKHESRCFHDECSVVHDLRSAAAAAAAAADLALLAASRTHSTSPVSHLYRSPLGTPPKSLVAPADGRVFGVVLELPTFQRDGSVYEASSKISAAKFKMSKFLKSLMLEHLSARVQVCQPPLPPIASSGGGSSPAAAGSGGLSPAVLHDGGGDGGPTGDHDDSDGDGPCGWGLGGR